jgi:ATP adenylyltransferase
LVIAILNLYPYTSGHLMVVPTRHVADLEALTGEESAALWATMTDAVRALKSVYRPDAFNIGANLGKAAGAGVPGHFHVHVLPRWSGDTNFMTSVADARVLPEPLIDTGRRLRAAWPAPAGGS